MADSYVCSGATMKCTMGEKTAKLTVLPNRTVFLCGQPMANISDHKSMVNLAPFGRCRSLGYPATAAATAAHHGHLTPMPCVHNTPVPWMNGKTDYTIKGQPALLKSCKCQCMWGGMISLVDEGQVGEGTQYVQKQQPITLNNQNYSEIIESAIEECQDKCREATRVAVSEINGQINDFVNSVIIKVQAVLGETSLRVNKNIENVANSALKVLNKFSSTIIEDLKDIPKEIYLASMGVLLEGANQKQNVISILVHNILQGEITEEKTEILQNITNNNNSQKDLNSYYAPLIVKMYKLSFIPRMLLTSLQTWSGKFNLLFDVLLNPEFIEEFFKRSGSEYDTFKKCLFDCMNIIKEIPQEQYNELKTVSVVAFNKSLNSTLEIGQNYLKSIDNNIQLIQEEVRNNPKAIEVLVRNGRSWRK